MHSNLTRALALGALLCASPLPALAARPRRVDAMVRRAADLTQRKQYAAAASLLRAALRIQPRNADAHHRLGYALAGMNRMAEAVREYRLALRASAQANWHYHLAYALMELKRYPEAVAEFRRELAFPQKNDDTHYNIGLCYDLMHRPEEAAKAYAEAVKVNPRDSEALNGQAKALVDTGKDAEALPLLDRALELNPRLASAYNNRAIARDRTGDREGSLEDADRALRYGLKDHFGHATRGHTLLHMGRAADAVRAYTRALEFGSAPRELHEDRAFGYLALGKGTAAAADGETAIRLLGWKNPKSGYCALAAYYGHRLAGREDAARRVIGQVPAGTGWTHQLIRFVRGELSSADLIGSAKTPGEMTEARAYSAFSLALAGQRDEAIPHLEWVVRNGVPTFVETAVARGWLARLKAGRPVSAG